MSYLYEPYTYRSNNMTYRTRYTWTMWYLYCTRKQLGNLGSGTSWLFICCFRCIWRGWDRSISSTATERGWSWVSAPEFLSCSSIGGRWWYSPYLRSWREYAQKCNHDERYAHILTLNSSRVWVVGCRLSIQHNPHQEIDHPPTESRPSLHRFHKANCHTIMGSP